MRTIPATTPPPPDGIRTPPAPQLGYGDSWAPYSSRKSADVSERADTRTPPPMSTRHFSVPNQKSPPGSPTAKRDSIAPTDTPGISPNKKRMPKMDSVRRASGLLTADSTAYAATALGIQGKLDAGAQPGRAGGAVNGTGMLPTPAKTPQKPPTEENKAFISTFARNLFSHDNDAMPAPKKSHSQQHLLDSFSANNVEESIEIFTDTKERVPEVDTSAENPFYGPGAAVSEPAKRKGKGKGKREMVTIPGEGKVAVDEAVGRDDGMVTTFRGKKQFVLFAQKDDSPDDESPRRQTRSSIKPRLLFPPKVEEKPVTHDDDEEAVTDIEGHDLADEGEDVSMEPKTPLGSVDGTPDAPMTPRFAPASPPTTSRVTRHGHKSTMESTPIKKAAAADKKSNSPLGWRVSKGSCSKSGAKRSARDLSSSPASKRARA